jgi:hypothetical protein
MFTAVILIVLAAAGLLLVLLAVVVVAIRQESRDVEMSTAAPSLVAVVVRRMLGVYLRRPAPPVDSTEEWSSDTRPTARPPCRRR